MEKTHDTLGRKRRDVKQKDGTTVRITPDDIETLAFLARHGGRLPTSYIHDDRVARGLGSYYATSRRLKLLARAGYITRPDQQFETRDPENNELVHEISRTGIALLQAQEKFSIYFPTMSGAFKHQVMLSCISASLELNARKLAYTYYPQHQWLQWIEHDHHVKLEDDQFTPDGLCVLVIDNKPLLVFLEIDRGTEPGTTSNLNRKSWKRSVGQYRKLISHKLYRSLFRFDGGAILLVVTISPAKQAQILDVVEKEFKGGCSYIMVQNIPEFGRIFHPPQILNLLGTPWYRAGHTAFKFA